MRLAVIGIGQSMRGDDAAGLEAVRLWQKRHSSTADRPGILVELVESPGLELLDLLDAAEAAILIDAVSSGAKPGSVHRLSPDALLPLSPESGSAHSWGVAQVLRLAATLDPIPARLTIRLLGIEVAQVHLGSDLSRPVRESLPHAADAIQDELAKILTS